MPAITVRGLDDEVAECLKQAARRRGTSVNALVRQLIREGLRLDLRPVRRRCDDLDELAGTWTAAEAREFERATEPFERVDEELWR